MTARARGLVLPGLLTLAGVAVLVGLGLWQLERRTWKEALIAQLAQRAAAPAVDLPEPGTWKNLVPARDEFRRVKFRAELLHEHRALVYTVGSSLRPDVSGPGYWVFTPARIGSGRLVFVNRGFLPFGREGDLAAAAQAEGAHVIHGAMRWPEPRGWFTPDDDPGRNLWYVRDHLAIAAARALGEVAPFYVDQEAPVPPQRVPRPGPLAVSLRNHHLQYALTWFGLALALAAVFVVWAGRPPGAPPPGATRDGEK